MVTRVGGGEETRINQNNGKTVINANENCYDAVIVVTSRTVYCPYDKLHGHLSTLASFKISPWTESCHDAKFIFTSGYNILGVTSDEQVDIMMAFVLLFVLCSLNCLSIDLLSSIPFRTGLVIQYAD